MPTRLPGDLRLTPADAARLLSDRFAQPLLLGADSTTNLPHTLGRLGIAGGAVHDALMGLAAAEHGADLATFAIGPWVKPPPASERRICLLGRDIMSSDPAESHEDLATRR